MKRYCKLVALFALGAALALAGFWMKSAWVSAPADWFEDKTGESGLAFTHRNGEEADHYTILESLGGGVALIDYDQDGLLDIFVAGGGHFGPNKEILGHPNRLFRNDGDWRFRDVTAEAGLPTEGIFYSHGGAAGDYNNDGWPDLLVTGYGGMALYQNRQGKFVNVTEAAGLADHRALHWSTSAAWADLNGDGHLDLFVGHYLDWSFAKHIECKSAVNDKLRDICVPQNFERLPPALYFNRGDGTFRLAGDDAGLLPGKALAVLVFDANTDGRPDIYVANDGIDSQLYLNQGGGKFQESGLLVGVAQSMFGNSNGSMGLAAADYNGTGLPSLFVTNYQDQEHCLYRNLGNGFFQHAEHLAGLSVALGRDHVGWGTGFYDFDLDGAEDLFVAHGHLLRNPPQRVPLKQQPALLRNLFKPGDQAAHVRFKSVVDQGGAYFRTGHVARGVAFGDLDNDGGIDLVICHTNEPVAILRNRVPDRGHWLGIELVGKTCRDSVGAKLTLEAGDRTLTRFVLGGGSYLSTNDRRVVFGLGSARAVQSLSVRWPSGRTQTWNAGELTVGRYNKLVEGDEKAEVR